MLAEALEPTNGREFERALRSRSPGAQVFYFDDRSSEAAARDILDAVSGVGQVVVAAYLSHKEVRQVVVNGRLVTSFGLLGRSGDLLDGILAAAPEKTVVVALGSPYLIENFPEIQTYACTYAMASTSEISAVEALFGEVQNRAKLPVTLPGIAPRGFALRWPTVRGPTQVSLEHNR